MLAAALLSIVALVSGDMRCPGSKASLFHASCELEGTAAAACSTVMMEVQARVHGQYQAWHDR